MTAPAAQNFFEDLRRQHLHGKRGERQCDDRAAAHRVDIRERVRRRDRAEEPRIVDDRGEEVDRLDDRLPSAEPVHGGVVRRLVADQEVRVREGGKLLQKRGEVELTDLAGSTGARRERRQRGMALGKRHGRKLSATASGCQPDAEGSRHSGSISDC
jgi:hypothetical protein